MFYNKALRIIFQKNNKTKSLNCLIFEMFYRHDVLDKNFNIFFLRHNNIKLYIKG